MLGCVKAQNSRLTISGKRSEKFYNLIKSSVLLVPIKSRDSLEEKALIAAVRRYWKQTPYQFISYTEWDKIRRDNIKPENRIFLIKETYVRLKKRRKDWAYTKYYITGELGGTEILDAPYIEFKLPVKTKDRELENMDCGFIYGLMIKQMDYDVVTMANKSSYLAITKKSLIKATFKNDLKNFSDKTLLVTQPDLENYMMNLRDSKKSEKQKEKFFRYISKKTKLQVDKIKFVTEQELSLAVSAKNNNCMIYTGFTIYNAKDGKMLRRIDPSSGKRKTNAFITVLLSVVVVGAASALVF